MKHHWLKLIPAAAFGLVVAAAPGVQADEVTGTQNVSVTIEPAATLDLGGISNLTFASANPTTTPEIDLTPFTLTASVRITDGATATLKVKANADFDDGTNTLDISNLKWVTDATASGFADGVVTKATGGASMGSWASSGIRTANVTFKLVNSFTHPVGTFNNVTLTYTLAAP